MDADCFGRRHSLKNFRLDVKARIQQYNFVAEARALRN